MSATWKNYLDVMNAEGKDAAWKFARKAFDKNSVDFKAAQRFHAPTAADKKQSEKRQAAIAATSKKEILQNCQFAGLRKLGK